VGQVTDSAGVPIQAADVVLVGTTTRSPTDERGAFRLTGVPAGGVLVRARRLGFVPDTVAVQVTASGESRVRLVLSLASQGLAPIVVRSERIKYAGRLAGYYERLEQRRGGYFITRQQIEAEQPRTMSHLLTRVPGLSLVRGRGGITGLRMRGRTCWPLVWLDGTPMPSGDVDMDSFAPQSIEGIELYLGGTTPPFRYNWIRNMSSCGTILIWSKEAVPPAFLRPTRPDVEALVASASVFTASEVDVTAQLVIDAGWTVEYPPALYASGTRGEVLAELIVDAQGRVEDGSVGIVSSTHPAFGDAVRVALSRATYRPAEKGGGPVRQLVHQPVDFLPPSRRASP
jgi:TonB family protein